MSLLMKALEKAAQDRTKTTTDKQPATTATHGTSTLSLEPIASAATITTTPAPRFEPTISAPAADGARQESPKTGAPETSNPATRSAGRSNEQTRAAVLLNTQSSARPAGAGIVAWVSTHPVHFTAALAGALAVGYAVYLYLQIAHPGLFLRKPVAQTQPVATTTAPPSPPPSPSPAPISPAASPLIPAQSVFSSTPDTAATPAPALPPASAPAVKPAPTVAAPAAATTAAIPVTQNRIVVSRGDSATPRINSAVSDAYAALEAGRFDSARRLYDQALRSEPSNIDALLGLAAIAQQENRTDEASKHYLKILDIDPRHALAQTGLIALLGRADPQAAESRLKQLAARDPSPALYFTLGNLYADQGQWSQAQQAYFQAHHLDAGNPDYAYNLAVALEHLGQPKLALGFYRRAVQQAAGRGRANFNSAQAQTRITQLAARVE